MTTNKKMYYDCALKAAYMVKNFGVKFICGEPYSPKEYDDYEKLLLRYTEIENGRGYCSPNTVYFDFSWESKIYVHPESRHIFEPQEFDLCEREQGGTVWLMDENRELSLGTEYQSRWYEFTDKYKIIQRNNRPFITPEIEDEK